MTLKFFKVPKKKMKTNRKTEKNIKMSKKKKN